MLLSVQVSLLKGQAEQNGSTRNKTILLNTSNPEKSNWIRFVRPAPARELRNVVSIVREDNQLYFVAIRDLKPEEEMFYWVEDPDPVWAKKRAEKKSEYASVSQRSCRFKMAPETRLRDDG